MSLNGIIPFTEEHKIMCMSKQNDGKKVQEIKKEGHYMKDIKEKSSISHCSMHQPLTDYIIVTIQVSTICVQDINEPAFA